MVKRVMWIAALAMMVTACGSGSASTDDGVASLEAGVAAETSDGIETNDGAAGEAAIVDPEEALLAFAACMRDNGVEMADPTVDADGNVQLARPGQGGEEAPSSTGRPWRRPGRRAASFSTAPGSALSDRISSNSRTR